MICDSCGKDVTKLKFVHEGGKLVGGCCSCMSGKGVSRLSTEKRWYSGEGYNFQASPAHLDDIRHRRISRDDGRSVIRSRK